MQTAYDYFTATGDFALKQIKNLTSGTTPSVISQFDYTYRQDRSIATWTEDQGSGAKTWAFAYDEARQLTKAEHRDASQTLIESLYYGYDKAGNRTQVGNTATAPQNYEANNLNQLVSARDHGRTTFAGTVNEPATVKVNGKSAKVMSTDGGAPFRFEALVDLDAGTNSVVVEAKDGQNNTSTKTYSVATTGTSKTYEYDSTGNLRYEKQPNGTVIREYRWGTVRTADLIPDVGGGRCHRRLSRITRCLGALRRKLCGRSDRDRGYPSMGDVGSSRAASSSRPGIRGAGRLRAAQAITTADPGDHDGRSR